MITISCNELPSSRLIEILCIYKARVSKYMDLNPGLPFHICLTALEKNYIFSKLSCETNPQRKPVFEASKYICIKVTEVIVGGFMTFT